MDHLVNLLQLATPVGAAGVLSIVVYVLVHENSPTSLLGGWRYKRDLREYFYLGVESGMEPGDARDWAVEQVAGQWWSRRSQRPDELDQDQAAPEDAWPQGP